jgi:MYXO-CTERM domain-containing protein
VGLVFQSNTGACTQPYGSCATGRATYNPSSQCGFATSPAGSGTLNPGQSFNITSTYTIDVLPRSVTSVGDSNEVDIVSDTNLINFGTHTQSALSNTTVAHETSCSVASTGSSSLAVVGLVVLVAYALNRRRRS